MFSGIGGFDLAAEWMGWENVFQVEIDKFCQKVLEKHFPNVERYGDIKEFDGTRYAGRIDVLTGGFPCQDISILNTRKEGIKGEKSSLWKEYARIIREVGPHYVVFENSPRLISRGLEVVLQDFSEMGYDVEWRYFYASEFGFPHHRERLYGLAYASSFRPIDIIEKGGVIHSIIPNKDERRKHENQAFDIPLSLERFNGKSNFNGVQLDNGFSKELDKDSIKGLGNAIVPQVAYEIFKAIESL